MGYIKKEDLIKELRQLGVAVSVSLTVPELKLLLEESRGPTTKDQKEVKVTTGMWDLNKAELFQRCKDNGIETSVHDTKDRLLARLKHHQQDSAVGTDDDVLDFGKHKGTRYLEALEKFPSYVQWAKTTVDEEPGCGKSLKRFVQYVLLKEIGILISPKVPVKITPKSTTKAETKVKIEQDTEASSVGGSSGSTERLTRLENMLHTLIQQTQPNPAVDPSSDWYDMDDRTSAKRGAK